MRHLGFQECPHAKIAFQSIYDKYTELETLQGVKEAEGYCIARRLECDSIEMKQLGNWQKGGHTIFAVEGGEVLVKD